MALHGHGRVPLLALVAALLLIPQAATARSAAAPVRQVSPDVPSAGARRRTVPRTT